MRPRTPQGGIAMTHTAPKTDTSGTAFVFSEEDRAKGKRIAWISYFGILFIVPLIAARNSAFARFHANQGAVYFLFSILAGAVSVAVMRLPRVGSICSFAIFLLLTAAMLWGVITAASGKAKPLPLIGRIRLFA